MAVIPLDADGVIPHGFDVVHPERGFIKLEGGRRGRLQGFTSMRAGAGCAGTTIAQVLETVFAAVAVLPVNLDPLGFGDRDMLRIAGRRIEG